MHAAIGSRRSAVIVVTAAALALSGVLGLPAHGAEGRAAASGSAAHTASPSDWVLAPSLAALRREIDTRWPDRDRSSDGSIGDARHLGQNSSHNPVGTPTGPSQGTPGTVHALDITAQGVDVAAVLDAVIGDARVWYVIHDGRIWSRTSAWAPKMHPGDPHSGHLHINLREGSGAVAAENDTSPWFTSGGRGASAPTRGKPGGDAQSTSGLSEDATRRLQQALINEGFGIASGATGWYGPETTSAVRKYQLSQGWTGEDADGIAGKKTLRRLGVIGTGASKSVAPSLPIAKKTSAKRPAATPAGAAKRAKPGTKKPTAKKPTAKKPTAKKPTAAWTPTRQTVPTSAGYRTFKPWTAHRDIYFMQQALARAGHPVAGGPTGYYGIETIQAVRKFQRAQGWSGKDANGAAGPRTLRALGV